MFVNYLVFLSIIQNAIAPNPLSSCAWIKVPNTNTRGGISTFYSTLDDCQYQCQLDPETINCQYGLDWDPGNQLSIKCWFSASTLTSVAPGVDHYYYNCSAWSTVSTSVSTSGSESWVPSSSTNSLPCHWDLYNNTFTNKGVEITLDGDDTLENCQAYCYDHMDACDKGIDYNPANPVGHRCYLSTDSTKITAAGIFHYEMSASCYVVSEAANITGTTMNYNNTPDQLRLNIFFQTFVLVVLMIGRIIFNF